MKTLRLPCEELYSNPGRSPRRPGAETHQEIRPQILETRWSLPHQKRNPLPPLSPLTVELQLTTTPPTPRGGYLRRV